MAGRLYKRPHLFHTTLTPAAGETSTHRKRKWRYGKIRDGGAERKLPPLNTAINQLAGANRCSPPSLAGWQHSGVIKIVTIDKSRWMEHFPPVLLGSQRVIIFVWLTHTEDRKAGACVCERTSHPWRLNLRAEVELKVTPRVKAPRPNIHLTPSPSIISRSFSLRRLLRVLSDLVVCEMHPSKR